MEIRITLIFNKLPDVEKFLPHLDEVAQIWAEKREGDIAMKMMADEHRLRTLAWLRGALPNYLKTSVSDLSSSK